MQVLKSNLCHDVNERSCRLVNEHFRHVIGLARYRANVSFGVLHGEWIDFLTGFGQVPRKAELMLPYGSGVRPMRDQNSAKTSTWQNRLDMDGQRDAPYAGTKDYGPRFLHDKADDLIEER